MLKIEETEVVGFRPAIRGMRNPKNSWDRCDTKISCSCSVKVDENHLPECSWGLMDRDLIVDIGENDLNLMKRLASGGPVHAKYRRMITVYVDITAPLYWWKEFDTYKVGTVANSCSTMHKIQAKEFTLDDFSHEHLVGKSVAALKEVISVMNLERNHFNASKDKDCWWQMIQLLPTSYNQKRTVMLNHEVLVGIYKWRKNHKLDEWHTFCDWIRSLPYAKELITDVSEEEEYV